MDPTTNAQLRDHAKRIRQLEAQLAFVKGWTGVCASPSNNYVPVFAADYDTGTGVYTIDFASQPGQQFQVQQSTDGGVTWTVADNVVDAAVSPAIRTVWESDPFDLDDLPRLFQVRLYPRAIVACPAPDPGSCPDIIT